MFAREGRACGHIANHRRILTDGSDYLAGVGSQPRIILALHFRHDGIDSRFLKPRLQLRDTGFRVNQALSKGLTILPKYRRDLGKLGRNGREIGCETERGRTNRRTPQASVLYSSAFSLCRSRNISARSAIPSSRARSGVLAGSHRRHPRFPVRLRSC